MKTIPDCANAIRELSSHLESPGEEHWKALDRLVGYLKANSHDMKLRPPSEAERVALPMVAAEIKFVNSLLKELLGTGPVLLSRHQRDNIGANILVNNDSGGQQTKHVDVRYRS